MDPEGFRTPVISLTVVASWRGGGSGREGSAPFAEKGVSHGDLGRGRGSRRSGRYLVLVADAHEFSKERMRVEGFRTEFRMELNGDEPGVVREFDDLDELAVRRFSGHEESVLCECLLIRPVELVAMPMPFVNDVTVVNLPSTGLFGKLTRILAQPHRASHVIDGQKVTEFVDNLVLGVWITLRRVGAL